MKKRYPTVMGWFATMIIMLLSLPYFLLPTRIVFAQSPDPTPLPDPLELPLPYQSSNPASAYRPPLYPVPWALSDNDHFFFTRPLPANTVNWPLSAYRYGDTNFGPDKPHTGVDIVVDEGTPVYAVGPGTVVWAEYGLYLGGKDLSDPYGLSVAIQHDFGYNGKPLFSVFAHLSQSYVIKGQHVETGQLIALSGNTGQSTAPHLHFEVRMGENLFYNSYNPELWTSPPQGWGILVGQVTNTWGEPLFQQKISLTNLATGESRWVNTYGSFRLINRDPYYQENIVFSDLPAGTYLISVAYVGRDFSAMVEIIPGAISFFRFNGYNGINFTPPTTEIPSNIPEGSSNK